MGALQPRRGRTAGGIGYEVHGTGSSLLLLHGLTFDRRTWLPIVDILGDGVTAALLDLPGHGSSDSWARYDLHAVVEALHDAADEVGLERPVVVGHSISGLLAFLYASRFPTAGVVDLDMVLHLDPFIELVRSVAPQLQGDAFPAIWGQFQASMHLERIPKPARDLVHASLRAQPELVLGYWSVLFTDTTTELTHQVDETLTSVKVPALAIHGDPPDQHYRAWLHARCPSARLEVWPGSGHFPHLVHARRFRDRLVRFVEGTTEHRPRPA